MVFEILFQPYFLQFLLSSSSNFSISPWLFFQKTHTVVIIEMKNKAFWVIFKSYLLSLTITFCQIWILPSQPYHFSDTQKTGSHFINRCPKIPLKPRLWIYDACSAFVSGSVQLCLLLLQSVKFIVMDTCDPNFCMSVCLSLCKSHWVVWPGCWVLSNKKLNWFSNMQWKCLHLVRQFGSRQFWQQAKKNKVFLKDWEKILEHGCENSLTWVAVPKSNKKMWEYKMVGPKSLRKTGSSRKRSKDRTVLMKDTSIEKSSTGWFCYFSFLRKLWPERLCVFNMATTMLTLHSLKSNLQPRAESFLALEKHHWGATSLS